jgi:hypothetical protein
MALDKCPSCKGRKSVMGMGMIVKNCSNCKGVGYVEVEARAMPVMGELKDTKSIELSSTIDNIPLTPYQKMMAGKTAKKKNKVA